jgi:hypothetical protein
LISGSDFALILTAKPALPGRKRGKLLAGEQKVSCFLGQKCLLSLLSAENISTI